MMSRRPSLTDRAMFVAARLHAQRVYKRFMNATRQATRLQDKVLLHKIRQNATGDFGRHYQFDRITDYRDFRNKLPVLSYDDHRPYIERVKAGELSALFGPGQILHMFALTSGTTDEPKYIPVTDDFLNEYRSGWNAFGIKALLDHPEAFLRGILQMSSPMDEFRTSGGIPCGAITGLMAATQKKLVRKYYVAPRDVALIEDAAAKYYTTMRLAIPKDVAFMITASPATQLKLARTADRHREQIVRDIHDGTLWPELSIPTGVRQRFDAMLRPDPLTAGCLEKIIGEHGRLLPRHYWKLSFLANWTGGAMSLYLQDFPEYFGDIPVRDVGLLASEGRISIPIEDGTAAGILDVTGHFYEFVPKDRIDDAHPPTLRSHQLEVGQEYFILLTTSSGLYRYDLRDLIRVVDYFHQAPVIEFLNKGDHICSLTGEKLTERQVILAMQCIARDLQLSVDNFVLAPRWGQPPHYILHVEQNGMTFDRAMLADRIDQHLQAVNLEYASKRNSGRLDTVCLNYLPRGFFDQFDTRQASRRRPGNEQYKHRYLYCRIGDDAEFPLAGDTCRNIS